LRSRCSSSKPAGPALNHSVHTNFTHSRGYLIPQVCVPFTASREAIAVMKTAPGQCKDPIVHAMTSTSQDEHLRNLVFGYQSALISAVVMCYAFYVVGLSQGTGIKLYKYWYIWFVAPMVPCARLYRTRIHKSYEPFHKPERKAYPRINAQYLNEFNETFLCANAFWSTLRLAMLSIIANTMSDLCQYYKCGISQTTVRQHHHKTSDMLLEGIFVNSSNINTKHWTLANYLGLCCDSYFGVGPDYGNFKSKNIGKKFLTRLEASSSLHLTSFLRDWGPRADANLSFNKLPKYMALQMCFRVQARLLTRRMVVWRHGTKILTLRLALDSRGSSTSEYGQSHLQEPLSNDLTRSVISSTQGRVVHSALEPVPPQRLQMWTSERCQRNYKSIPGYQFILQPILLEILKTTIGSYLPQRGLLAKVLPLLSSSDPKFTRPLGGNAIARRSMKQMGWVSVCTAVYPDLCISFGASSVYGDNTEVKFLRHHSHSEPPLCSSSLSEIPFLKLMHENYVATSTAASPTFHNYFESSATHGHNTDIIRLIPHVHSEPPLKSFCFFRATFLKLKHKSYVATSTAASSTHHSYHNPSSTFRAVHEIAVLRQKECIKSLFDFPYLCKGYDLELATQKYVATRTVARSTIHNCPVPSPVFQTVFEITVIQPHGCTSFLPRSVRHSGPSEPKSKHKPEPRPKPPVPDREGPINRPTRPFRPRPVPMPSPPTPDGGGPINRPNRPSKLRPIQRPSPSSPGGGGFNNIGLGKATLFGLLSKIIVV
jgi:hypothetical protein